MGFPIRKSADQSKSAQLTAAYRKLLRPSSPVIAKAFTMCTYLLVPITLDSF